MSILEKRLATTNRKNVLGTVRPGCKVLTGKSEKNPQLQNLYKMAADGHISYQEMEKRAKALDHSYPLKPINTEWFNIHPTDFVGGVNTTNAILEEYGEKREGDKVLRLYEFPIVFSDSTPEKILDAKFQSFTGKIRYMSKMSPDGKSVECHYIPEVSAQELAENKARKYTKNIPIKTLLAGECNPEICDRYRTGVCQFRGKLYFHIPGVTGNGVLQMPTGSNYSMQQLWSSLWEVYSVMGRVPSFDPTGQVVFKMTKKIQEITFVSSDTGAKLETKQPIPWLTSTIDTVKLLKAVEMKKFYASSNDEVKAPDLSLAPANWTVQNQAATTNQNQIVRTSQNLDGKNEAVVDVVVEEVSELKKLHALSDGFVDELVKYAVYKYGVDWENKPKAIQNLLKLVSSKSNLTKQSISQLLYVMTSIEANKFDYEKIWGYFNQKYPTKDTASLEAMRDFVDQLSAVVPEYRSQLIDACISVIDKLIDPLLIWPYFENKFDANQDNWVQFNAILVEWSENVDAEEVNERLLDI